MSGERSGGDRFGDRFGGARPVGDRSGGDRQANPLASQLIIGLFIIGLGVLFTLDNLHVLNARDYLRYWPVALMALGVVKMTNAADAGTRSWGVIFTFAGGVLLLNNLGVIRADLWDFWPLLLVTTGAMLVWRGWQGVPAMRAAADSSNVLSGTAIMSGLDRTIDAQAFHGGELTAIMGGGKIDLTRARITNGPAVINIFALMGGMELRVPENWVVENKVVYFMGGAEDKTRRSSETPSQRLILKGFVMMGGVEIRN
jgi:hypothetical protein